MYEIVFSDLSLGQLKKLDKLLQKRILIALERCRFTPHHFVKKLIGNPYFRLRVGDYRIIMDIKQGQLMVLVLEIGHRKNIYDS